MTFIDRHINRISFPKLHILICEDDAERQVAIINHLRTLFGHQGEVIFSTVSGGAVAAAIIAAERVDLIILDHDMPHGNAIDLMQWMKANNKKIPIITASGIVENNKNIMKTAEGLGLEAHKYQKEEVIIGWADQTIVNCLKKALTNG